MPIDPDADLRLLIPGIQYAESRGQANPYEAVGDAGMSRGAFQIQPIMYEDIQRIYPEEWGPTTYEQMLETPEMQEAAVLSGLRMLRDNYGLTGDALISGWNTGPTKARKGIFNAAYVKTVKQGMKRKGNRALEQLNAKP